MNILITGASGFIGQTLTSRLLSQGHSIRVMGRNEAPTGFENSNYDCLIHLAGRAHVLKETATDVYQAFKQANVDYSLKVAQFALHLQIKKFVFLSSIGVNGKHSLNRPFTESDTPEPHNDYAQTKWEAESALKEFFKGSNTALTIIRPPLVYGPNPKANFSALLSLCCSPLPLPFGAIDNRRSLISIDNLCHFIELCCTHQASANQTFLISDDHDISLNELVSTIRKTLHRTPGLIPIPMPILKTIFTLIGKKQLNQQLLGNLQIDTTKAKQVLNWRPLISFDEGIKRAVINNVI
jgi:UDP-glucose 4-epimerase